MSEVENARSELIKMGEGTTQLVTELSVKIFDFLMATPQDQLQLVSFFTLMNATNTNVVNADLIRAVSLLVSSHLHLLDSCVVFVDEDETEFEIPNLEFSQALNTGQFIHPEMGTLVSDFRDRTFPYFVPSARLLELKSS